jgi:uncharacterized protein YjiS (DUF1127 family)
MDSFRQDVRAASRREPGSAAGYDQEISSLPMAILHVICVWLERARSRRALRELDAYRLADIGLSRHDALREASKPFWRQ